MSAQNCSKLIAICLLLSTLALASNTPARAQSAARGGSAAQSGHQIADPADRPFDPSITVPELFDKAREAFELQHYNLAETFYQEILIRERSNVQAMLELANVYERSGRLEYARGLLARSAKVDPANAVIVRKLASVERMLAAVLTSEVDSLISAGQYELAIPKLSVHVSIEPDNPELFYKRALCYSRLGRLDAALTNIDKALQLDPREDYYSFRLAVLEDLKTVESREMVEEVKRLIQSKDPENTRRALQILGEILQTNPEHSWALSEIRRLRGAQESVKNVVLEDDPVVAPEPSGITEFLSAVGVAAAELGQRHLGAILLFLAALVVFQSRLTHVIVKKLKRRPFLSGTFPRFTLTEILVLLNSESHTGILHVKGDACRGKIYFDTGEPCDCSAGKKHGVAALHHLMSNTATGYFEFSEGSIPLHRTIDTPLTVILIEHPTDGRTRPKKRSTTKPRPKVKSRMKELLDAKSGK